MSKEDLIPMNRRSETERKRLSVLGGKKSGETRRRKKLMKEWAEVFGSKKIKVPNADGTQTDTDYDGAVVAGMYRKAIQEQDVRAAEFLAKLTGQLAEQVELSGEVKGAQIIVQDKDTAEALATILKTNDE